MIGITIPEHHFGHSLLESDFLPLMTKIPPCSDCIVFNMWIILSYSLTSSVSYQSGQDICGQPPETQRSDHAMGFLVSALAIVLGLALALVFLRSKRPQLPYPPGPPPKPLIGNALDIPSTKPWITYRNWAKEYNSTLVFPSAQNNVTFGNLL